MHKKIRRWWPHLFLDVVMNGAVASALVPEVARALAWKSYGAEVHRSARIQPGSHLGGRNISIGAYSFINHGVIIDGGTTIGSNVGIGPGSYLCTHSHEIGSSERRIGMPTRQNVTVGDGVWIGANVTVLPGVAINSGCVIAAGAVVTEDCEPNSLYAGVPARKVKTLDEAAV